MGLQSCSLNFSNDEVKQDKADTHLSLEECRTVAQQQVLHGARTSFLLYHVFHRSLCNMLHYDLYKNHFCSL